MRCRQNVAIPEVQVADAGEGAGRARPTRALGYSDDAVASGLLQLPPISSESRPSVRRRPPRSSWPAAALRPGGARPCIDDRRGWRNASGSTAKPKSGVSEHHDWAIVVDESQRRDVVIDAVRCLTAARVDPASLPVLPRDTSPSTAVLAPNSLRIAMTSSRVSPSRAMFSRAWCRRRARHRWSSNNTLPPSQ